MSKLIPSMLAIAILAWTPLQVTAHPEDRSAVRERIDSDGDGTINWEEFSTAGMNDSAAGRFSALDANQDGAISRSEADTYRDRRLEDMKQAMDRRTDRIFSLMDQDDDGTVSLEEVRRGRFDRIDRNADGRLQPHELRRNARGPHMGQPGMSGPGHTPGPGMRRGFRHAGPGPGIGNP